MKTQILLALFLFPILAFSQNWEWVNGSMTDYNVRGHGIVSDKDNNAYVTGYFTHSMALNDTLLITNNEDYHDFYVAKYNEHGELAWGTTLGTAEYNNVEAGEEIAINDDHLYIAGRANSHTLLKYNFSGNLVWGNDSGLGIQKAEDLAIDNDGNIFITGGFEDSIYFDNHKLLANQDQGPNCFLTKYSSDDKVIWTTQLGGNGAERGKSVATDNNGNIYLGLHFTDTITINQNTHISNGSLDLLIVKFDKNGIPLWSRNFGSSDLDRINKIDVDNENNVYVIGFVRDDLVIDGNTITNSGNGEEAFLIKFDENGNFNWVKKYGTPIGRTSFLDLNIKDNELFISGSFQGEVRFDFITLSTGILWIPDGILAKFDLQGNPLEVLRSGSLQSEWWRGFHLNDYSDDIYVTGAFRRSAIFDTLSIIASNDNFNMMLAKYGKTSTNLYEIQNNKTDILIYPNPVLDKITVIPNQIKIEHLTVYSLSGGITLSIHYDSIANNEINLEKIPSGIYIIEFKDKFNNRVRKKIIKK